MEEEEYKETRVISYSRKFCACATKWMWHRAADRDYVKGEERKMEKQKLHRMIKLYKVAITHIRSKSKCLKHLQNMEEFCFVSR